MIPTLIIALYTFGGLVLLAALIILVLSFLVGNCCGHAPDSDDILPQG